MKRVLAFFCLLSFCLCASAAATEPNAQKLDLRFMNLTSIALDSARAASLVELDISGNPVTELPAALKYAKNLRVLKLNYCSSLDLSQLAALLQQAPLEELEMNDCRLTYLPYEIAGLKQLKKLSVRNNVMEELPWSLYYNKNLESLDAENNDIEEIKSDITNLTSLKNLNLGGNPCLKDEKLYADLKKLPALEILNCSGATKLPQEWALPTSLRELVLNDLRADFPKKITDCDKLEKLTLQNNNYADLEKTLGAFSAKNLTGLSCSGRAVNGLPPSLSGFSKLQSIDLATESISSIPENLGMLTGLQKLRIKTNDSLGLDKLLKAFSNNPALTELDLSESMLPSLPDGISNLHSLQRLAASNASVRNLGSGIYKINSINEVDLRGNQLSVADVEKLVKAFPTARLFYDQLNPVSTGSYISKPFPQLTLPSEQFSYNPQKDTTIITANGTRITIPAQAIVDKKGNPVKERVQISYTTYYDPLEIFASGIPMTADSAGVKKSFASAGMFTLNASTAKGQQVYLKKGQRMKVDFVSKSPNESYNYYYLDTVQKNWVQTGRDNVKASAVKKKQIKKPFPKEPKDPTKVGYAKLKVEANARKKEKTTSFRLVLNESSIKDKKKSDSIFYNPHEVKELSTNWIYKGELKGFEARLNKFFEKSNLNKKKTYWSGYTKQGVEILVTPNREKDCFNIIFHTFTDSIVVEAVPAVNSKNPADVQKKVKKMYDAYYLAWAANDSKMNARLLNYTREYNRYKLKMNNYRKLLNAYHNKNVSAEEYNEIYGLYQENPADSLFKVPATTNSINRYLELTGFGTYNCDYFMNLQNPIAVTPSFRTKEGKKLDVARVSLVDLERNGFITASPGDLKFGRNVNYWVFAQTEDKKIGFATLTASRESVKDIEVKMVDATNVKDLMKQIMYQ